MLRSKYASKARPKIPFSVNKEQYNPAQIGLDVGSVFGGQGQKRVFFFSPCLPFMVGVRAIIAILLHAHSEQVECFFRYVRGGKKESEDRK